MTSTLFTLADPSVQHPALVSAHLHDAIQRRSERTKFVYPQPLYQIAHRALAGDRDADFDWARITSKRRPSLWKRVRRWLS